MLMATVFLRFIGLGPFLNSQMKSTVTLTLRHGSSPVNAFKVYECCAEKVGAYHGTDELVLSNDKDFGTFKLKMQESSNVELNMKSNIHPESRVLIPAEVLATRNASSNPATHVLPTENGAHSVAIDVLSSFPLPEKVASKLMNLSGPSSHEFFSSAKNLVFGHRGMGVTYKLFLLYGPEKWNPYLENTIDSFNAVAETGGDGIEFDTVMTKDLVPVVYHDFYVALRTETPNGAETFVRVPIHDLTFEDIKTKQLYHGDVIKAIETQSAVPIETFRLPNHNTFPTLVEVLRNSDPRLAFNLEVKYPRHRADGSHECEGYHERNLVADKVINDLAEYAGDRPILISSFDFDFCLVHGSKQDRWPVAAITHGIIKTGTPWADKRIQTIESSSHFAKGSNFWGISAKAEDLISDKSLLAYVRDHVNTDMMVWGDDVNNADIAASLMPNNSKNAANIIITDNVSEVVEKCKRQREEL